MVDTQEYVNQLPVRSRSSMHAEFKTRGPKPGRALFPFLSMVAENVSILLSVSGVAELDHDSL